MFSRPTRYLIIFTVCAFSYLLAAFVCSPPTFAASDPITITAQTDIVTFPKGIDFQVSAIDQSATITEANIYLSGGGYLLSRNSVPVTTPAHMLTLQWHDDTTGKRFIAPGSTLSYYWIFIDSLNNTHTGTIQTFTVTDTRFTWQHANQGLVQVNWYNRSTDFGQNILTQATTNTKRIGGNLGGNLLQPINLWVYQNTTDFHGALAPGSYEWVGGIAFPSLNEAAIVAENLNDATLTRDMPHELTHLIFHQLTGTRANVPTWFDEGMAVYNQVYHEPGMKLTFKQALTSHSLLTLDSLTANFPANADTAYLAYAQSWNLLDYMFNTFGQPKIAALVKDINATPTNFDGDVNQALGMDVAHLENQWRVSLNQSPSLTASQLNPQLPTQTTHVVVASNPYAPSLLLLGIVLIIAPLLGLGGLYRSQRRSQQQSRIALQAQGIINTTLPPYGAMNYNNPYMDTPRYPNPAAGYAPYDPYAAQRAAPPRVAQPPAYQPGQEYMNRRPNNQAPQD